MDAHNGSESLTHPEQHGNVEYAVVEEKGDTVLDNVRDSGNGTTAADEAIPAAGLGLSLMPRDQEAQAGQLIRQRCPETARRICPELDPQGSWSRFSSLMARS